MRPNRNMYVGRRPRRRGYGCFYSIIGLAGFALLGGLGAGLFFALSAAGIIRLPTATPTPTTPTPAPVPLIVGQIVDAYTDQPMRDVVVQVAERQATAGSDGGFRVPRPSGPAELRVVVSGYAPHSRPVGPDTADPIKIALRPSLVRGTIRDVAGQPVSGARVTIGQSTVTTGADGRYEAADIPADAQATIEAMGYARRHESIGRRVLVDVTLRSGTIGGLVRDRDGRPVPRATVVLGDITGRTEADGRFRLSDVPESGNLIVKASGYAVDRRTVQAGANLEITLAPQIIKGIYVTQTTVADERRFAELIALVRRTELNAMVIDVKGEDGLIHYESKVPLAREIGAVEPVYDIRKRLQQLRDAKIYVIARQVIMNDATFAKARPQLALRNRATGQPWRDSGGYYWMNAFRSEVWDYNISIAKELAELGVDEVQFDYVRFPSDGRLDQIDPGQESTEKSRTTAIATLLTRTSQSLMATGTFFSADLFGLTTSADDDMGIGQKVETIADAVDYICPMVYPSHYARGSFGIQAPATKPYEIVSKSLFDGKSKLRDGRALYRPWLQDFDLYGVAYSPDMVRAQIRAAEEQNASGWLLWNIGNKYQEAALRPGS